MSSRTHYDEVLYPSALYPQTHPDCLATLGTLLGLTPTPVESCRVLELGCGDGQNLIAMALTLPGSTFCGIDLASVPIEKGMALARELGVTNVSLLQRDLLEIPDDFGDFDFIIAHGLYSWVPQAVREKILAIGSRCLSENGIAYISYNAQPGNHLRELARGFMRYHAAHFKTPSDQIKQARAFLQFMAGNFADNDAIKQSLQQQLKRVNTYPDAALFHDDLSACNTAFYFHEFAASAARHGLQFLAEADITEMQTDGLPQECVRLLEELPPNDAITREQYLDFFRARAFRQTLICRKEHAVRPSPDETQVSKLYVASSAKPVEQEVDVTSGEAAEFRSANNAVIATQQPLIKAALLHLGKIWPQRISFVALLALAKDLCGSAEESNSDALSRFLLKTWELGFTDLHTHPGKFSVEISALPKASPLARLQIESSDTVATLRHTTMKLDGALSRELLKLLDGTRSRSVILEKLVDFVAAAKKLPEMERREITRQIDEQLDANLEQAARGGLLCT
ncbi:MAG TPA: class I SAM-dependent methyltransferase [Methylomirabilota bacterium]|nr:class I SAM-dependent methyltransferase [Methylomirabilota bacterium]